ncbi:MAG: hypothetical protein KGL39_13370 [Patescibacteria group bacterium]|nr:hypothetical protein [Patescibacteria group bacterium]
MNSITITPFSGDLTDPYPAADDVTKSFADWGIKDDLSGALGGFNPDQIKLVFAGQGKADDIFPYRALVRVKRDGINIFTGNVPEDPIRLLSGRQNEQHITIKGPLWALQQMPYRQLFQAVTAIAEDGTPTYVNQLLTHFRLNLPTTPNIIGTAPVYSLTYTLTLWNSAQQIFDAVNYAKARGVWIDCDSADLMAVPVEPGDVSNISCWDAIRKQCDNYDCALWFDYTQDPPKLHVQRASALLKITRQKGNDGTVQSRVLRRRSDLKPPFVQITYEQPYNLGNGVQGTAAQTFVWPAPPGSTAVPVNLGNGVQFTAYQPPAPDPAHPVDELNAIITNIPLRGISQQTYTKFIQTDYIAPNQLAWWQRRKADMNPAVNPSFATDYANLAIIPNSGARSANPNLYPNIIIDGGWASWMGGNYGYDHIVAQATYHRRTSAGISGSKVTAHTLQQNAHVTNLDYPNGALLSFVTETAQTEFFQALLQIPQLAYEDLAAAAEQYEGTINLVEIAWPADLSLGKTFAITGDRAEYAAMSARIQRITFTIKSGAIFFSLDAGANKSINASQFKARMDAARWRYVTSLFIPTGGNAALDLPRHDATDSGTQAHPALSEQNVYDPDPAVPGKGGLATITGGAGNPGISLGYVDATGAQDPTKPQVQIALADLNGI